MVSTTATSIIQNLGNAVKEVAAGSKCSSWWYTPHLAAASRSIAERIPFVDFVLEVRDARIPLSSECKEVGILFPSSRRIVILNEIDLAKQSEMKEWTKFFARKNSVFFQVNAHNKESIKELLNFLQARARELIKTTNSEKEKLKHATVSSQPGETKHISSLKVCSSNVGALADSIVWKIELARYFLAILNLSKEYTKWAKLSAVANDGCATHLKGDENSHLDRRQKRQFTTDHTQDFVVNHVRRTLFEAVSSFSGNLEDEEDFLQLIESELSMLHKAFRITPESNENDKVAIKLLDLYRTGKLGHYLLETIPRSF